MLALLCLVAAFSAGRGEQFALPDDIEPACLPIDRVPSTCKSLQECPHAIKGIREGRFPKPCRFRGKIPDVCCPSEVLPTTTTQANVAASRSSEEGDICRMGSSPWYCKRLSSCPSARKMLREGKIPSICPIGDKGLPLVCCQPSSQLSTLLPETSNSETILHEVSSTRPHPHTTTSISTQSESSSTTPLSDPPTLTGTSGDTLSTTPDKQYSPSCCCNKCSDDTPLVKKNPPNRTTIVMDSINGIVSDSKAEEMCKIYGQYVFKRVKSPILTMLGEEREEKISFCGRAVRPLIVGGENARPREFPHMARIGYGHENKIEWLCGGSLISERFVLSAAHCTKISIHRMANWVSLGDLDTSTDEDEADPVTINIIERIVHPGYDRRELYHDIALFKLGRDAPLGIYIRPICLNTEMNLPKNKIAIATGWGRTEYRGRGSSKLQKVDVELVETDRCNKSYHYYSGKGRQLPRGIVSDYMICAGGESKKDACQGDSGGPLQIVRDSPFCTYSIIGVTSFGRGCGTSTPGVYTNVANYVTWIENIVWRT